MRNPKWFSGIILLALTLAANAALAQAPPSATDQGLAARLNADAGGTARISYHSQTGKLRFFGTDAASAVSVPGVDRKASAAESGKSFLAVYGSAFGIKDPGKELRVMRSKELEGGGSMVRYQQIHRGVPVFGGELIVHQTKERAVTSANGEALPDLDVDVTPTVNAETAKQTAAGIVAKHYGVPQGELSSGEPELWIYNPILLGAPAPPTTRLVWRLEVNGLGDKPVRELVLVNAQTGKIALNFSKIYHAKNRITYTANSTASLPGTLARSEGQGPVADADVNAAHDYAGNTYDFYFTNFGRDSINGSGMSLVSTVKYCPSAGECPYLNAFWNGTQMVYGASMTADDVVGHELTHGVTDYESGLFYYMQSGAINEALSDIFGEFVDLTNGAGNDSPAVRWQMGEDLPTSIGVIRNMQDPTIYGDPDRIKSPYYYCGDSDNGGVHWNSGVANKCAYLMVDGASFNGKIVTGIGITKAARVWYEVQANYLTSAGDYADVYDYLIQAALGFAKTGVLTQDDAQQVKNAADAVEMNQQPTSCATTEAPYCSDGMVPFNIWFDNLENTASGFWAKGNSVGGNKWYYPQNTHPYTGWDATYATSGIRNFFGDDPDVTSDSYIAMTLNVTVPSTTTAFLHFRHAYGFERGSTSYYDGGVIEYSTNNGSTWTDAGSLIVENGYKGVISGSFGNPLAARSAFVGSSSGYISTRLNLSTLSGQNVRFRFRIGSDSSVGDWGWYIDDIRFHVCGYAMTMQNDNPFQSSTGWSLFAQTPSDATTVDFDAANTALRARVSSDATRFRVAGWFTNVTDWLPYHYVGTDKYVRGKFYVYATGQASPSQLNSIPNIRMRLSNRFAATSMLEVSAHSSKTAGDEPLSLELRPSSDPAKPSLYRVDYDPVDVPYLRDNAINEGISRGFEAYATDPQDNGYIALAESVIGTYPIAATSPTFPPVKVYLLSTSDAGDLKSTNPGATLEKFSIVLGGAGEFGSRDNTYFPAFTEDTTGVTMDSTGFNNALGGNRVGIIAFDLDPGSDNTLRVRVEEQKQYKVRFHVTSTQNSNLNPQFRMRARTVRFAWTQKFELGGAWAINTVSNSTLAAQMLPGVGCQNPDKAGADTTGGWYNLLLYTPMSVDIRPDVAGPLSSRMPNISSQPGPGSASNSLRDLKVGIDLLDSISTSINAGLEAGNFKVDRIDIWSWTAVPD